MRGGQRHTQGSGGQQHDNMFGVCGAGDVFGMSAERDAGLVDDALVHRPGDQGSKAAGLAVCDCLVQGIEDIAGIRAVQDPGLNRRAQCNRQHAAFTGRRAGRFPVGFEYAS